MRPPARIASFQHWIGTRLAGLILVSGAAACSAGTSGPGSPVVSISPSVGAEGIASPNYTLDLALTVEVDANNVVQSVTGTATLIDGSITGGSYYVDQGALPAHPTIAQLDSAQSTATMTAILGANPSIAASSFGLDGVDLTKPVVRTVVIERVLSSVRSYQTLAVTFTHP